MESDDSPFGMACLPRQYSEQDEALMDMLKEELVKLDRSYREAREQIARKMVKIDERYPLKWIVTVDPAAEVDWPDALQSVRENVREAARKPGDDA